MRTLLMLWCGEPLYEEDAPREQLIEIIKYYAKDAERVRKQHEEDLDFFTNANEDNLK